MVTRLRLVGLALLLDIDNSLIVNCRDAIVPCRRFAKECLDVRLRVCRSVAE